MNSNVFSLKEWWAKRDESKSEVKVRYIGWDHNTRFLKLLKFDDQANLIEGELDCGKKMNFSASGKNWVAYDDGMENEARAI